MQYVYVGKNISCKTIIFIVFIGFLISKLAQYSTKNKNNGKNSHWMNKTRQSVRMKRSTWKI